MFLKLWHYNKNNVPKVWNVKVPNVQNFSCELILVFIVSLDYNYLCINVKAAFYSYSFFVDSYFF